MQDLLPIPSCFYSGPKPSPAGLDSARLGQTLVSCSYRARIACRDRAVAVTWCKNLLAHGLSVSIEGSAESDDNASCRVDMRPWSFWRKHGSKRFDIDGETHPLFVFWDLRCAKYSDEQPEPTSDYYVAVIYDAEVVLLLGDLKKDAFRRANSRPSMFDAILVSKKEHVFGKKRFSSRAKFHAKGKVRTVTVEMDTDMVIKIDGDVGLEVRHLQWKFRGNDAMIVDGFKLEVYWDVHDWLFGSGPRHALFIFKAVGMVSLSSETSLSSSSGSEVEVGSVEENDFCLFVYAWKVE